GGTRGPGAPPARDGLPLRDARPGGVPLRQPERARQPGEQAAVPPGPCDRRVTPPFGSPTAMTPIPAPQALDRYFLEARRKLPDLAAILDRIGRGRDAAALDKDARLERIRRALEVLHDREGGRAERIQQIFSLDYDAGWERPQPR